MQRFLSVVSLLLVLAALVSAMFFNGDRHVFLATTIVILLLLLIFITALSTNGIPYIPKTPLTLSMLAFWAWLAVTQLWSIDPTITWVATWWHAGFILIFFVAVQPDLINWQTLNRTLIAAGITLIAVIVIQAHGESGTPHGTFYNKNNTATLITVLLLPVLATYLSPNQKTAHRWFTVAAIGLFVAHGYSLGIVGSRGAILGTFFGATYIALFYFRQNRRTLHNSLTVAAAYCAGLIISNLELSGGVASRLGALAEPTIAGKSRFTIWQSTLQIFSDHSWLGIGPGTFHLLYRQYRLPSDETSYGAYVHNDYLQILVEYGIPGLLLFLLLTVSIIAMSSRLRTADPTAQTVGIGMLGAITAVAIHSLFTFNFYVLPIMLVVGLYLAFIHKTAYTHAKPLVSNITCSRTTISRIASIGLVTTAIVSVASLGISDYLNKQALAEAAHGQIAHAEKLLLRSEAFTSDWAATKLYKAWFYTEARKDPGLSDQKKDKLFNLALENIAAAKSLSPYSADSYFIRGYLYQTRSKDSSDTEQALLSLRKAVRLAPSNHLYRLVLVKTLKNNNYLEQAEQILKEGKKYSFSETNITREFYKQYADELATSLPEKGNSLKIQ